MKSSALALHCRTESSASRAHLANGGWRRLLRAGTLRSLAIAVAAVAAVEQLALMARQEAPGVLFVTKQCVQAGAGAEVSVAMLIAESQRSVRPRA